MQNHISRAKLAARWELQPNTLAQWARQGKGPEFIRVGGRVVYDLAEVEAWEAANKHASTASIDTSQQQRAAAASVAARRVSGKLPAAPATGQTPASVGVQAGCN